MTEATEDPPEMHETLVQFLDKEDPLEKDRLPTPVFLSFPCGSAGKESACNSGDLGLIPGLGRSPGEGKGYPLQYSGLETRLSDFQQWMRVLFRKTNKQKLYSSKQISEKTDIVLQF